MVLGSYDSIFLSRQNMVSVLLVEYSIHPTQAIPTHVRDLKQCYFAENYIFYQLFVNFSPLMASTITYIIFQTSTRLRMAKVGWMLYSTRRT